MASEITGLPSTIESCKVCTPTDLANAIVERLIGGNESLAENGEWIDPCVGTGALVRAVHESGVSVDRIFGVDLDEQPDSHEVPGRIEWEVDFFSWAKSSSQTFDCLVANPPFVQLSKVPAHLKKRALSFTGPNGGDLSRRGNYWCSFLGAGLELLSRGGSLAFILPASWDYADYAAPFRDSLQNKFGNFEIHRCDEPLFSIVDDGCVVIIGEGYGSHSDESLRHEYESPEALISSISQGGSISGKDHTHISVEPSEDVTPKGDSFIRLGDIMGIRLGGVTGDAKFFLLTDAERRELSLPKESCVPALTRSDHLKGGIIDKSCWENLCSEGERVWLFRPPQDLAEENDAVQAYLQRPEEEGGCRKGYKVRNRRPWYRTPLPSPVHGFLSGTAEPGPWIAVNQMSSLTATNTLYVVNFSEDIQAEHRHSWAISLLTTDVRSQLEQFSRRYPQGLSKYEPGDIMDLRIPVPKSFDISPHHYQNVIDHMLEGDAEYLREADAAVKG
jgi:hypothetical protein